jgi:hypothetical protein
MLRIYGAADLQDAHILLGLLRQAGIAALVLNEHARGGLGDIPFGEAYPEVWIEREADRERARRIVEAYQAKPVDAGVRYCAACGEQSPGNFHVCWNCGATL